MRYIKTYEGLFDFFKGKKKDDNKTPEEKQKDLMDVFLSNCDYKVNPDMSVDVWGDVIKSEWRNGLANGWGIYYYLAKNENKNDKYVGQIKDFRRQGRGTYYYRADNEYKGDRYEGEWLNDKIDGKGIYTFAEGGKYIGESKNGMRDGKGILIKANGKRLSGIWKDGNLIY